MGKIFRNSFNRSALALFTAMALLFTGALSVPSLGAEVQESGVESVLKGEYKEGEAIICIQPSVADEKRILAGTRGLFDKEPAAESGFLMDVSEAQKAFSREEGNVSVFASGSGVKKTVLKLVRSDTLSTEELIKLYTGKKGVLFAEPNYIYSCGSVEPVSTPASEPDILLVTSTETGYPDYTDDQYGFGKDPGGIDVPDWNTVEKKNAEGVVVAVLDSGVDYNHPDLKDVMWKGGNIPALTALGGGTYGINVGYEEFGGTNPTNPDDPMDINGHGTHCSGIIAAAWNGFGVSGAANGAKIMAVKIATDDYGGLSSSTVLRGFNYVITAKDNEVDVTVANCSFGGPVDCLAEKYSVRQAGEKGIVVCYASGNDSENNDLNSDSSSVYTDTPTVINVNSMDINGNRSTFSNYGIRTTHLFAPGTDIMSTIPREKGNPAFDVRFSPAVKDAGGKALYDDFSSDSNVFEYKADDGNGTKLKIDKDKKELILSGTDLRDIKDNRTILFTVKAKATVPEPGKDRKYHLIFSRRIADEGDWYLKVYVKTVEGKWERPALTSAMGKDYAYDCYPLEKSLDGNEFDLKNLEIQFHLQKPDSSVNELKECALGDLWITDAETHPYAYDSGTSMSAPAVTGEVAILAANFKEDSAEKRAARVLAGAKSNEKFKNLCITGGMANVSNSLDKNTYTPVIYGMSTGDDSLHIDGYFFGNKEDTEVVIKQGNKEWSTSGTGDKRLYVTSVERDDYDPDHCDLLLKIPDGMTKEEASVTVKDRAKTEGRQSYTRILTPSDPGNVLPEGSLYKRIAIAPEDQEYMKDLFLYNAGSLNGSVFFDMLDFDYYLYSFRIEDGGIKALDSIVSAWGNITAYNGELIYADGDDNSKLIFNDGEGHMRELPFIPLATEGEVAEEDKWIYETPDENDHRMDLYYDGRELLLIRQRIDTDDLGNLSDSGRYAVYSLDPATGKGTFLGKLKNDYYYSAVIAHEEREGQPNTIYIIGKGKDRNGEDSDFVAEKMTVELSNGKKILNTVDLSDMAPPDGYELHKNEYWSGCGIKNGIYLTGAHTVEKEDSGISTITADNYFLDYTHPEKGFQPCEKRISEATIFYSLAVAGYGRVYFLGQSAEGLVVAYTDAETLPHYGDKEKEKSPDYSEISSPLHATDGHDIETVSAGNAKYSFDPLINKSIVAGTKADVSAAFTSAPGYDENAKHRYILSSLNDVKKPAKINKKGILIPKKRGEIEIECQQKVKGGSWEPIGNKLQLYIQIPEMVKKNPVKESEKGLSAYAFLSKTTYSPTSWISSNEKVATVDEYGNITILKAGNTNIIAVYGEGKTGSKKKYKTKLKVSK